jgi:hypothetical protein
VLWLAASASASLLLDVIVSLIGLPDADLSRTRSAARRNPPGGDRDEKLGRGAISPDPAADALTFAEV